MRVSKKERKKKKKIRMLNKRLVKKYPWLMPRNVWTGKILNDYNYTFTEYDCLGEGWQRAFGKMMLEDIDEELRKNNYRNKYIIYQVKEKYGELRWYDNGGANESTQKYEAISQNVCYFCGRPDTHVTDRGWILPVCKRCDEKQWRRNSTRTYEEVICDEDPRMADTYEIRRSSKDGDKIITFDYSDTTNKIRIWWNKNHPDDQVEIAEK